MLLPSAATFLAVAVLTYLVWRRLFGRRRAHEILGGLDGTGQQATRIRVPNLVQRWEQAARQAGLNWPAQTYLLVVGVGLAAALFFGAAQQPGLAVTTALAATGGPWALVKDRQRRRSALFAEQLPAALTLAANTIRAGGTMLQAVRAIARQLPEPTRGEFARVEQALQLHVPLSAALDQARQRIGAEEFAAVVVACKVGGQAGADLDVVLENIAREIVEERQFRQALRAASAEGRMSARIVTAIPVVSGAFFLWSNPRYFDPILTAPGGRLILIGCFCSVVLGWGIISRLTDIRTW